ncbi:hypothetical protein E0U28_14375 [Salmonella enterica subsp. enterica serovar Galiema]|nr:hypothetical protein [Salmonella enterica subsp. enterica serovar Galiema]ECF6969688.1 hypothetical protein [Salmonella enterica subsp. enterica]ECT6740652.1 hypothetical protein [Salmonella enterica subsp. enterica serovar Agona]
MTRCERWYQGLVFPAPAGINRVNQGFFPTISRVPRASGDKPAETETGYEPSMCSPRQRG